MFSLELWNKLPYSSTVLPFTWYTRFINLKILREMTNAIFAKAFGSFNMGCGGSSDKQA